MAQGRQDSVSRGLAIYRLLLELYPRAYLRQHREELLQNFQDLEQTLLSKTALWRLIAKDLAVSLWSEFTRTFSGQTTVRFALLSLMLAIVHRYPGQREEAAWTLCFGYALGWFAGWFGWRWRMSSGSGSPRFVRSFRGQAAMLGGALTIVLAAGTLLGDFEKSLVFAFCYGVAIAWFPGWWVSHRRVHL